MAKKKPAEATKNAAAAVRAYLTAHRRAKDNEIRKALAEMGINLVPNPRDNERMSAQNMVRCKSTM